MSAERGSGGYVSRRRFIVLLPATATAVLGSTPFGRESRAWAATGSGDLEHPEPRPGIDGSSVLSAEDLAETPHAIELYDRVRTIAHVVDGIRCYCGCAGLPGRRSLLSCYEEGGMARYCDICQGEARLAWSRHQEGQSLAQIRRAIDARFGF